MAEISIHALREEGDHRYGMAADWRLISIHALREEGDSRSPAARLAARRISIHALREEGDVSIAAVVLDDWISIHALREEGDHGRRQDGGGAGDFYPRPPRGGRRSPTVFGWGVFLFLSTPSARRATSDTLIKRWSREISIHALREEGDAPP